jgi:uncharacterized membrane protein
LSENRKFGIAHLRSFVCLFVRSFVCLFVCLFVRLFVRSFVLAVRILKVSGACLVLLFLEENNRKTQNRIQTGNLQLHDLLARFL